MPISSDSKTVNVPFHSLADLFPLLEGAEFDALVEDVRQHGLREPIVKYEEKILDGRNRYRACRAAGIEPVYAAPFAGNNADALAFVISANIHRRHFTPEQKRDLIAKLLKASPEKSDRSIAKVAKVHNETVAAVRKKVEGRDGFRHVDKRTDTKGRQQPVSKPARQARPSQEELQKAAIEKINAAIDRGFAATNLLSASEPSPSDDVAPAKPEANKQILNHELAAKLDPLFESLFAEGQMNMATMVPCTVAELATRIEWLLVEYGVMPESRRSKDPQAHARSYTANQAIKNKRDHEQRQQAVESAMPPPLAPIPDDYLDLPTSLDRSRKLN